MSDESPAHNSAVSSAIMAQHNPNKTVLDYFNDLNLIFQREKEPVTSINTLFILVLAL
jgi:hypothetical protein